jgi:acyl carrier protein
MEEDAVAPGDTLGDFESWDSLAALSVAALADEQFGVTMSSQEINDAVTVQDLYDSILAKKGA